MKSSPAGTTTLEKLKKVPGIPCLYRHENGSYYGKKKLPGGKRALKAFVTSNGANITDRELAKKALRAWIDSLTAPAPLASEMTFAELWVKFEAGKAGNTEGTRETYAWAKQCIDVDAPEFWKRPIVEFKPSHLTAFFAKRKWMAASSFNGMTTTIKNVFAVAFADELISSNPYDKVPKSDRRKKKETKPDEVPTIEECEQLVAHIRSQEFADTAGRSGDMVELMHVMALGQAELTPLDWEDVKWNDSKVIIWKRRKTGVYFEVPFFGDMEAVLRRLWEAQGKPELGKLIAIRSPKQAIYNACKRLNWPRYSPRDLRKARITWLLRQNVPVEAIAKAQGHRDNGVLIRRTYANVITTRDREYFSAQFAKTIPKPTAA